MCRVTNIIVTIHPMTPTIEYVTDHTRSMHVHMYSFALFSDYSTVIEGGTIVVRNGTVQCVGTMVSCQPLLSADCQQYSLTGVGGVVGKVLRKPNDPTPNSRSRMCYYC
jgi:hypothetical protein